MATIEELKQYFKGDDTLPSDDVLTTCIDNALAQYSADFPLLKSVVLQLNEYVATLPEDFLAGFSEIEAVHTPAVDALGQPLGVGSSLVKVAVGGSLLGNVDTLDFSGEWVKVSVNETTANIEIPPTQLKIISFSASVGLVEKGREVNVMLSWSYSDNVDSQLLNGAMLDNALRVLNVTLSSSKTFTLTGNYESKTASASTTVKFVEPIWFGRGLETQPSVNDLVKRIQNNENGTYVFSSNTDAKPYLWIVLPATANPSFKDPSTGFNVAMQPPVLESVTNEHGYTQNYNFYRSLNALNGAITVVI